MTFKRLFKSTLSLVLVLAMLVSYLPAMTIPVKAVDSEPGTPFTPKWYVSGSPTTITSTGAALKFTDVLEYYYEGQKEALYASGTNKPNTWSVTDQTDGSQLHKLNDGLTNWTQSFAGFYVKAKAAVSVTFKIDGLRNASDTSYSAGVYDMSAGKWDVIWGDPNAEKMTDKSYYTASAPATLMAEARTVELEKGDVIFLGFYAKGGFDTGNFQANITLKAEAKEQLATYNISPADGALVDNVWKNDSVVHFPMTITVTKDGVTETVKGKQQVTDDDQLNASFEAAAGSEVSITYKLLTVDPNSKDPENDSLSEFPVVPGYIRDGAGVVQNPEWTWSSNTYTYTFTVGEGDVGKTHNWTYDIVPQYYPIKVNKTGLENATVTIAQNGNLKNANATLTGSSLTFYVDKHNVGSNVTFTASGYEPLAYDVEWYLGGTKVADGASYTAAPDTLIAGSTVEAKFIKKMFSASASVDSSCSNMGSVSVSSGSVGYGESVTFTATPRTGYEFVGWVKSGEQVSTSATFTIPITEATNLVAVFKASKYNVSVGVHEDCSGMGTATVEPNGSVNYGTSVTFTATANTGYKFIGWYDANGYEVSTTNPYTTTANGALSLVAKFEKVNATVSVINPDTAYGSASLTHNGSSQEITSSAVSVTDWMNNTIILEATANNHYSFKGWQVDGVIVSTSAKFTFTLGTYAGKTIVAVWQEDQKVSATFEVPANGSITIDGVTVTQNRDYAQFSDENVALVATPADGYHFVHWIDLTNDAVLSTEASFSTSLAGVNGHRITAVFAYNYVEKTFTGVTNGTYTVSGGDLSQVISGSNVTFTGLWNVQYTLTAVPAEGYKLIGWYVNGTFSASSNLTYSLGYLAEAADVYPVFAEKYVTITLPAIEAGSYTLTSADGSSTITVSTEAKEFQALRDTAYTLSITLPATCAFLGWFDDAGNNLGMGTEITVDNVHGGVNPKIENRSILQKLPGVTNGSYTIQVDGTDVVLETVTTDIVNFEGRYDLGYTLTAIPADGYHFVMWVDGNGNPVSYNATLTGRKLSESESVSPVFVSNSVTMRFPAVTGATYYVYCGDTLVATVSGEDVFVTGEYDADYRIVVGDLVDNYKDIGYLIDADGKQIEGSDADDFTFKLDADKVIVPFIGYYGTDITLGAVIGNGQYTFGIQNGATIETVTNADKLYSNMDANTTYVLTATAGEGYKFAKWQTKDGKFLSDEATLVGNMPASVVAVFVKEDSAAYSVDGVPYYYLDAAAAAALKANVKNIVVEESGSIYHSQGLASFEIPAGVTLIVPHKEDYLFQPASDAHRYACVSYVSSTADSYATVNEQEYLKLTLPKNNTLTVKGIMAVGGTLNGVGAIASGEAHAKVYLEENSSLIVGDGINNAYLTVCGFIYGPGKVEVKANGLLYLPFAFNDFKGGGYTVGAAAPLVDEPFDAYMNNAEASRTGIVPFNRYTMMGVQSEMTVRYSGYVMGYVDMFAGGGHNKCMTRIIHTSESSCMIALKDENATATITYDPSKTLNNVGRTKITLNGNTALGGLSFSINVGVSANINTRKAVLPIPYNFEIEVASGTFSVPYKTQLLPGATIRVNEGAVMNVTSQLTVYKALVDKTSAGVSVKNNAPYAAVLSGYNTGDFASGYHVVSPTKPYPATADLKAAGFCGAGELIVNGTLNLNSGSSFGGIVQTTTNTGVINVAGDAGLTTYTRIGCAGYWQYIIGQAGFMYELAGATQHNLTAQLMDASGNLVNMVAGKTYYGVVANNGTIDSYTYTLCYAANVNTVYTTSETANGLGISVQGAWSNCNHQWTDATCTAPKTCSLCGVTEGEALGHKDADNNHICDNGCDVAQGTHEAAEGKHTCDYCHQTVTQCADEDTDHDCDVCGDTMGTHEAAEGKHTCDYCHQTVTQCADEDTDHDCDVCGTKLSECADNNNDHDCDVCGVPMGTHEAAEGKHTCDYCGQTVSDCADSDNNHNCDVCGDALTSHNYENGTCTVCGAADPDADVFTPTIGNGATNVTVDENGNVTFKAGTADAAPEVTVTAPAAGWVNGENTFTVASENDIACVVIVKNADGDYIRLTATTDEETGVHSFTAELETGFEIIVAVKGDANGDGSVGVADRLMIAACLGGTVSFDTMKELVADVNKDGSVGVSDRLMIAACLGGSTTLQW